MSCPLLKGCVCPLCRAAFSVISDIFWETVMAIKIASLLSSSTSLPPKNILLFVKGKCFG